MMKRFSSVAIIAALLAALALTGCPSPTASALSTEANFVSISFEKAHNPALAGDYNLTWNEAYSKWTISGGLPYGTNVTSLIATFAVSTGATVSINGTAQVSGTTANNFTSALTYTVTAEDGTTSKTFTVEAPVAAANADTSITAFSITSNVSGTSVDYAGDIDTAAHTIKVFIPYDIADKTALAANYTLGSNLSSVTVGGVSTASGAAANFSSTVTFKVTAQNGTSQDYVATLTAKAEKLMFTEYFGGVSNNKYVEITNTGTESIDLADYAISMYANGAATANCKEKLIGTLPAGKSVCYANFAYSTTTLTTLAAMSTTVSDAGGWKVVEPNSSNITYFNGNDALVLAHSSLVVDTIGTVGSSADFAPKTILIRKPGKAASSSYAASDWNSFPVGSANAVGDDWSAGRYAAAATGSTMRLFAINGVRGIIDGTNYTITITLPGNTAITALVPTFMTDAASVMVGTTEQASGTSANNFTSSVTYKVSTGSATQNWVATVVLKSATYTTTNYDFDGGLSAIRSQIGTSSTAVTLTTTSATGIVTAIPATNKFYLQDKNCGLCFYMTNGAASLNVGDKVTVACTQGKVYSGLIEVTAFTAPTSAEIASHDNAVYYIPVAANGSWQSADTLNRVYYVSNVAFDAAADRAQSGLLNSTGANTGYPSTGLITRCPTTTIDFLPAFGTKKDFYGVIDPYTSKTGTTYQMVLYTSDQIR